MIDTHAHLNFSPLLEEVETVVAKSRRAGLTGIIIASSNLKDSKKAIELAQKYSGFLWAAVGIHPQKTDPDNKMSIKEQLARLEHLLAQNQQLVVAVGESGLDFGSVPPEEEERSREEQEQLFIGQIELALKYQLPLIIHARQANDQVIKIIRGQNQKELRGVFHCYSGGKKRIEKVLALPGQWYFGVDGNLTYDSGLQNVVSLIPSDRLLLETDAPFLAPEPYRGQTCYPYYLPLIAAKAAEIWNQSVEEVIKETRENSQRLFNLTNNE